ncbi:MAG: sensor histidine kinase [Ignavibacteriaceae bacterium]
MLNNPIFGKAKYFIVYILSWIVIASIYFLLLYLGMKIKFEAAIIDSLVFSLIYSGLGLGFWYPARYITFENNRLLMILLSHLFAGILSSIIWLASGYFFITNFLNYDSGFAAFFSVTIAWRLVIGALFYYLITLSYYLIIYYKNFQDKIAKEAELKNLITEAELKTLKFQINPHFIFNSLNSMSALTTINPGKAREMILKLADFLRFTLANNEKQNNTFGEELKNIKLYLEIEKIRFDDKFEFIEDVDDCCNDALIPNMILQPLFENAIKHAVYETLSKVNLKLSCKKEDGYLKISFENNYEPGSPAKKGAGIGLQNIESRLKLIYNQDNLLNVEKAENLFKVTLFIPRQNL